jgi:hypothetical protein
MIKNWTGISLFIFFDIIGLWLCLIIGILVGWIDSPWVVGWSRFNEIIASATVIISSIILYPIVVLIAKNKRFFKSISYYHVVLVGVLQGFLFYPCMEIIGAFNSSEIMVYVVRLIPGLLMMNIYLQAMMNLVIIVVLNTIITTMAIYFSLVIKSRRHS